MTEDKRFIMIKSNGLYVPIDEQQQYNFSGLKDESDCMRIINVLNILYDMKIENEKIANYLLEENEQLKKEVDFYKYFQKGTRELKRENKQLKEKLKRCRNWINSDKDDYELVLAFIKNKGYSLKDVLEYERELKKDD